MINESNQNDIKLVNDENKTNECNKAFDSVEMDSSSQSEIFNQPKSGANLTSVFADSPSTLSTTLNSISSFNETTSLLPANTELSYQNLTTIVKEPKIESLNSPDFLFSNQLSNQHHQ